jgi:hypothetical protein
VKDNLTPKLLLVVIAVAALSLAIWSGVAAQIEAPAQASTPAAAFATPF